MEIIVISDVFLQMIMLFFSKSERKASTVFAFVSHLPCSCRVVVINCPLSRLIFFLPISTEHDSNFAIEMSSIHRTACKGLPHIQ